LTISQSLSPTAGLKVGDTITVKQSMNEQQIGWFKAGSALNLIAKNAAS